MLIMQLGRAHTLYLPHGHVHSGAVIGSLQTGQRVVLLGGSADMASPFQSLFLLPSSRYSIAADHRWRA
jgi:hypothetical protein